MDHTDLSKIITNSISRLNSNEKIYFYGIEMSKTNRSHSFIVQKSKIVMVIPKTFSLTDIAKTFISLGFDVAKSGDTFNLIQEHPMPIHNDTFKSESICIQPEY